VTYNGTFMYHGIVLNAKRQSCLRACQTLLNVVNYVT